MSYVSGAMKALQLCGPRGLATVVAARLRGGTVGFDPAIAEAVASARVLEIGGPSNLFRSDGLVPVYGRAAGVDNVNYAGATLWEANLSDGGDYGPEGRRLGTQWLREATELGPVGPYDAVISSHTIEHTANPLKALREWCRVTRPGGALVLVVPHVDGTFDHRRPVSSLAHLLEDEAADVDESDRTHVDEILRWHDVDRDPGLPSHDELRHRVESNVSTRSMHHHVFDTRVAWQMVAETGWSPQVVEARWPHDIVILARKGGASGRLHPYRSPFPTDRRA